MSRPTDIKKAKFVIFWPRKGQTWQPLCVCLWTCVRVCDLGRKVCSGQFERLVTAGKNDKLALWLSPLYAGLRAARSLQPRFIVCGCVRCCCCARVSVRPSPLISVLVHLSLSLTIIGLGVTLLYARRQLLNLKAAANLTYPRTLVSRLLPPTGRGGRRETFFLLPYTFSKMKIHPVTCQAWLRPFRGRLDSGHTYTQTLLSPFESLFTTWHVLLARLLRCVEVCLPATDLLQVQNFFFAGPVFTFSCLSPQPSSPFLYLSPPLLPPLYFYSLLHSPPKPCSFSLGLGGGEGRKENEN